MRSSSVFHTFTGCDQTSAFAGRGKSTALNTRIAYQEGADVFRSLSKTPTADEVSNAMPTQYLAARGTNVRPR